MAVDLVFVPAAFYLMVFVRVAGTATEGAIIGGGKQVGAQSVLCRQCQKSESWRLSPSAWEGTTLSQLPAWGIEVDRIRALRQCSGDSETIVS